MFQAKRILGDHVLVNQYLFIAIFMLQGDLNVSQTFRGINKSMKCKIFKKFYGYSVLYFCLNTCIRDLLSMLCHGDVSLY